MISTFNGDPIFGVLVSADNGGDWDRSDEFDGSYSLTVPPNWTGRVEPSLAGWKFDPQFRDYPVPVTSDQSDQDFIGAKTSFTVQEEVIAPVWYFNRNGDLQGWNGAHLVSAPSVSGGLLRAAAANNDPQLYSPKGLRINADHQSVIEFRMKASEGTYGEIFFRAPNGPFSGARKIRFSIPDNDSFVTMRLCMRGVPGWSGEIEQIRLDPCTASGAQIELDHFLVSFPTNVSTPVWRFDRSGDLEGWKANKHLSDVNVTGGSLSGVTNNSNPTFYTPPGLDVDAADQTSVHVRMKADAPARFRLCFKKYGSTTLGWMGDCFLSQAGEYADYYIDLSGNSAYRGKIVHFGIRFISTVNTHVDVDLFEVRMPTYRLNPAWNFNTQSDPEGWRGNTQVSPLQVNSGWLQTMSLGNDPFLRSPLTSIDTRVSRFFMLGMQTSLGSFFQVFPKPVGGNFSGLFKETVSIPTNDEGVLYAVDLGRLDGYESKNLNMLRLDPTSVSSSSINIDCMGMLEQVRTIGESFEFNHDGNLEGWTRNSSLGVPTTRGGVLRANSINADPQLYSPNNLFINTDDETQVALTMKVTKGRQATLFYKRAGDPAFAKERNKVFPVGNNTDFVTYNLNLGSDPSWSGVVKQLRLDPTELSGAQIFVDSLRVYGPAQLGDPGTDWRWSTDGDVEGWVAKSGIQTCTAANGCLNLLSYNSDPYLYSTLGLGIEASKYNKWVVIRMKVSAGTQGDFFYRNSRTEPFSASKCQRFALKNVGEFVTYQLYFGADLNWDGVIDRFRFDPTNAAGATVEIDYILVR